MGVRIIRQHQNEQECYGTHDKYTAHLEERQYLCKQEHMQGNVFEVDHRYVDIPTEAYVDEANRRWEEKVLTCDTGGQRNLDEQSVKLLNEDGDEGLFCKNCSHSIVAHSIEGEGKFSPCQYGSGPCGCASFVPTVNPDGAADEIVDGRRSVYGDVTESMSRVAEVWSGIIGSPVHAWQVPLLMVGLKLVRTNDARDYSDNSDDVDG